MLYIELLYLLCGFIMLLLIVNEADHYFAAILSKIIYDTSGEGPFLSRVGFGLMLSGVIIAWPFHLVYYFELRQRVK